MRDAPDFIAPDWPAPPNVRASATTRRGGVSAGSFASFNLALHVNDDGEAVLRNRALLKDALGLAQEPMWLQQVHGATVWSGGASAEPPTADASITRERGVACAILTADCLPVLFCNAAGSVVAAAHAGWRGLVGGVLEKTVAAMKCAPSDLMAWLGPAIEPSAFEVGDDVVQPFIVRHASADACFVRNSRGRWQADLYELARIELRSLGIANVYGGGFATFADAERFYSYRREKQTGRMATLIWMTA